MAYLCLQLTGCRRMWRGLGLKRCWRRCRCWRRRQLLLLLLLLIPLLLLDLAQHSELLAQAWKRASHMKTFKTRDEQFEYLLDS